MSMSVFHPDFILFRDFDIFLGLVGLAFVDEGFVGDLVAFFDGEEVVGHGLVGEFVEDRGKEVHGSVNDVESSSRAGVLRGKVFVEFGVEIEFVLHVAREMGAEDRRFVRGRSRAIVADCGIFAESHADTDNLGNQHPVLKVFKKMPTFCAISSMCCLTR